LVEPITGGDPMSEALYVRRSLQHLSDELAELGHAACPTTVADLLEDLGYRLQPSIGPHIRVGRKALPAALRSVYFDDATAREAAESQRDVQRDRAGRDHFDRHSCLVAEAHDRALAELPLDLEESGLQGLIPVARPLGTRPAVCCHWDSLPG